MGGFGFAFSAILKLKNNKKLRGKNRKLIKDQPDFVGKGYRTKIKFSIKNSNNKKILEEIYKSRIKEKKKAIMVYSVTGIILIVLVLFLFG